MRDSADRLLKEVVARDGTDLHLAAHNPPHIRVHGTLGPLDGAAPLTPQDVLALVQELVGEEGFAQLMAEHELDTAITLESGHRLRINAYLQQDTVAAALRLLPADFFPLDELGLPLDT